MVKDVDNVKYEKNGGDNNEKGEDKEPEIKTEIPTNKTLSPEQIKIQQQIEGQLGLARFLDYTVNEPFELIYQKPLLEKYQKQLIDPYFGEGVEDEGIDGRHFNLKQDFEEMEIQKKYTSIIDKGEDVAAEHGINRPYLKKVQRMSLIIISAFFIVFLVLTAIDSSGIMSQIYFPIAIVMCFLPRFIQKYFLNKWSGLKEELEEELKGIAKEDMEDVKIFIQYLLDDVRERLLENHLPLQVINFMLLSEDYENVKTLTTQDMRNIRHYILQFKYPEGMQPFEVPKQLKEQLQKKPGGPMLNAGQGATTATSETEVHEDDENDDFILLKNPEYNEEGQLVDYDKEYPKPITKDGIEELLSSVKFQAVDKPELVMPNFHENSEIKCKCGEPVKFNTMKTCVTELTGERFEFYLVIGKKCKCGLNPYVLFTSPGNLETPQEYVDIFRNLKTNEEE